MGFDAFLKLDGVKGESQDDKNKGEIQLVSFAFGADQPASSRAGAGAGVGKVNMDDLAITKNLDAASPMLHNFCCTGKHIPSAVLSIRKAGGTQQTYTIITLKDLIVSSFKASGHPMGGDDMPTESVTLNYTEMKIEYKEQNPDGTLGGSVKTGFNIKTMKSV